MAVHTVLATTKQHYYGWARLCCSIIIQFVKYTKNHYVKTNAVYIGPRSQVLDLGFEGPGLGLGLRILALTTSLMLDDFAMAHMMFAVFDE